MKVAILILVIISQQCYAQADYNAKLSARLEEIRKLNFFDNNAVNYDSTDNGWDFPNWDPAQEYIQDDIVRFKIYKYRAAVDTKGKNPTTSPNDWYLIKTPRPYPFLKDTAKTEDLKALLASDHPYIRLYAFAALTHRNYNGLFQIIVDNLRDTTKIEYLITHGEDRGCPADLMLLYTVGRFSSEQKDILKKLILTKYTHLNALDEVLLFHKPKPDEYQYVKKIVKHGIGGDFGLIALSRYQKTEDIELIRTGLKNIDHYHYNGYQIYFLSIENFPHKSFKKDLIDYKTKVNMSGYMTDDDCYFKALAAYQDKECLKVLEEFVYQKSDDQHRAVENRDENLGLIYQALKKHYTPMYDNLMKRIEKTISKKSDLELNEYRLDDSPWNY